MSTTTYVDAIAQCGQRHALGGMTKVLVGGVGAGGRGLYALNITDPTAARRTPAAASKIMWEITPTTINNAASTVAIADLGYTVRHSGDRQGLGRHLGGDRRQRLQQPGQQPGGALRHQSRGWHAERQPSPRPAPQAVSNASPNGLSSPTAVDTDHDGKIDYVYAGDINGNMWKFDLTQHRVADGHQALHDEPGAADHRPAGGVAASARRLHGQLRHRPDVHERRRDRSTTVYYAYGIRDNGTHDPPTPTSSARR